MDTLAAMFNDHASASSAVDALVEAGFPRGAISLLVAETTGVHHFKIETGHKGAEGAIGGGVAGGALGAIAAGLVVTGIIAAPGVGLIAAGPIVAVLAGLGAGATAGSAIGALVGLGIPEHSARVINEQLARGGILVALEVQGQEQRRIAERVLRSNHAVSISRAAA